MKDTVNWARHERAEAKTMSTAVTRSSENVTLRFGDHFFAIRSRLHGLQKVYLLIKHVI